MESEVGHLLLLPLLILSKAFSLRRRISRPVSLQSQGEQLVVLHLKFFLGVTRHLYEEDMETESLNIINDSEFSSTFGKHFLSQLTTPCATPRSLSPRLDPIHQTISCYSSYRTRHGWDSTMTTTSSSRIATPKPGGRAQSSTSSQPPLYLSYSLGLHLVGLGEEQESWNSSDDSDDDAEWGRSQSAPVRRLRTPAIERCRPHTGLVPAGARRVVQQM